MQLRVPLMSLLPMIPGLLLASGPRLNYTGADASPVPESAGAALEFPDGCSDFFLGEPIDLTFILQNQGAHPFSFDIGGDNRGTGYPTRYQFTVADEKGEALSPDGTEFSMMVGGLGGTYPLRPGEVRREDLCLQNYVRLDRPGRFTVQVTHDFGWAATQQNPLPVAQARITVRLPAPEEAAALVRATEGKGEEVQERYLGRPGNETDFRHLIHPCYLPALEEAASRGVINAFEGIHRIPTMEASEALIRLLKNGNESVRHAAGVFLLRRLPPRQGDQPAYSGAPRREHHAGVELWTERMTAPLRETGRSLVRRMSMPYIFTGAHILQAIGEPEDAELVLPALEKVLYLVPLRTKPQDDLASLPEPGNELVYTLQRLRERGYRAPPTGGMGVLYAQLLEVSDRRVPRREGWERILESACENWPSIFRQRAIVAFPRPATGRWLDMIMQALNDPDRAVMREACLAAGESGNERFVKALAAIVRVEAHPQVVEAASEALVKLQAPWPATDAWIERLAHDEFAQEAVIFLSKRLDHPVAAGSMAGGRGSWHREDRLALRDSWQTFFAEPHRVDLVKANQPVPVTEAEAMNLLGAYSWQLDSRERWPSEKK